MSSGPTFKPRLATENGRRVSKTAKAKRLAATPATEAARLMRCLLQIRKQAEEAKERASRVEKVLEAAWLASGGDDRIVARALAREALIEGRQAGEFSLLIAYCQMAEDGTLCA